MGRGIRIGTVVLVESIPLDQRVGGSKPALVVIGTLGKFFTYSFLYRFSVWTPT